MKSAGNHSTPPLRGSQNAQRFGGGYEQCNIPHARTMRKEPTPWEQKLWLALKGEKLEGFKFRRQQLIGNCIADFYNAEKKLIIELDGSQHVDSAADKVRSDYLVRQGYRILRFWNNDVDPHFESVLAAILDALRAAPHRIAALSGSPSRGEPS